MKISNRSILKEYGYLNNKSYSDAQLYDIGTALLPEFMARDMIETFENWLSEFLQLI
jgi:hypothetical protein